MGMEVPLGVCPMGGSWLELLGCCMETEARWAGCEGPKEVAEGRKRCWLGPWGWLEELALDRAARDRGPAWGLLGSLEPLAELVAEERAWDCGWEVVREVLPGTGWLGEVTVGDSGGELVEESVEDLGGLGDTASFC